MKNYLWNMKEGNKVKYADRKIIKNNESKPSCGYHLLQFQAQAQAPTPTDFPVPPNPGSMSKAFAASCRLASSIASLALRAFAPRGKLLPAAPSLTKSILWITKDMPS
jgi:hypothetical protein